MMGSVVAGDYWLELHCTVGTTVEKYLVKCTVTGRGKTS
jgi:hypothetical protein